jgi:hypothetical protein
MANVANEFAVRANSDLWPADISVGCPAYLAEDVRRLIRSG